MARNIRSVAKEAKAGPIQHAFRHKNHQTDKVLCILPNISDIQQKSLNLLQENQKTESLRTQCCYYRH